MQEVIAIIKQIHSLNGHVELKAKLLKDLVEYIGEDEKAAQMLLGELNGENISNEEILTFCYMKPFAKLLNNYVYLMIDTFNKNLAHRYTNPLDLKAEEIAAIAACCPHIIGKLKKFLKSDVDNGDKIRNILEKNSGTVDEMRGIILLANAFKDKPEYGVNWVFNTLLKY